MNLEVKKGAIREAVLVGGVIGEVMSSIFGEEREELREFLASCSSSVAISD